MAAQNKVLNKIDIINIRDINGKDFASLFSASEVTDRNFLASDNS